MMKSTSQLDFIGSWTSGIIFYENSKIGEVVEEVERQFDVDIAFDPPTLEQQYYSGFFATANLDSALQHICWPLRLAYQQHGNQVTISKK